MGWRELDMAVMGGIGDWKAEVEFWWCCKLGPMNEH
jgi:hypothetical protein